MSDYYLNMHPVFGHRILLVR